MRVLQVADIEVSDRNPRRTLRHMDELTASIDAHGLLQPLVVHRRGRRYELIAGQRRLEAVRRLGWEQVPVVLRSADADGACVLRLVENLQRSDLRPAEEAAAFEALMRERGWSTRQVAAAINRSQAYVSKRTRVFDDPLLAPAVLCNELSISAAEELLSLDERNRHALLSQAIAQRWDRQQVRAAAHAELDANDGARRPGLTRRIHQFRLDIRGVRADLLSEADRRELRMLYIKLGQLAPAPIQSGEPAFPKLPG